MVPLPEPDARYAIYYAPPAGSPLESFARSWLGRDAASGESIPRLDLPRLPADRYDAIIRSPRHYGFHATLKPPFRLAAGRNADSLRAAVADFVAARQAFDAPALTLRSIDGFLALTLGAPCEAMDRLAADCVETFDSFRRPPDAAELASRRAPGLSDRQDRLLQRWGYPYVFEEFRFHMTLTGRLDNDERATVEAVLAPLVAPFCADPLRVDGIAIFRQRDRQSPFRLIERFAFAG